MEVEENMPITNFIEDYLQIASLHLLLFLLYNIEKCKQKCNIQPINIVDRMELYFIKSHAIKIIAIKQPLVSWFVNFLIEYLLFSDAFKDKDDYDYPWMRCLIEDRFEEISENGSLMPNEDYMMDMFSSIASK